MKFRAHEQNHYSGKSEQQIEGKIGLADGYGNQKDD